MIIYIHGFSSSGQGAKAQEVKAYFTNKTVLTPSLSYIPSLALETLEQIIVALLPYETVHLIGSSLGGYYAIYLANKYKLKAVLINPSIEPYETLKKIEMYPPSYYDGSTFQWKQEHINTLKSFEVKSFDSTRNFMLLLQKGDEALDYTKALTKLHNAITIVEEGGSHAFENFSSHLEAIEAFLR